MNQSWSDGKTESRQQSFFWDHPGSSHSTFFSLPPYGFGSPLQESFPSLLGTLASLHYLTPGQLVAEIILPKAEQFSLSILLNRGGSRYYQRVTNFLGNSADTRKFVDALQDLTAQSDLDCLTLLPLVDLADCRSIFRTHKAWCSPCLSKLLDADQRVREPFLWLFRWLTHCPVHRSELESACSKCGSRQPVLGPRSVPGSCYRCSQPLVSPSSNKQRGVTPTDSQLWLGTEIGNLIASLRKLRQHARRPDILTAVQKFIKSASSGSLRDFSQGSGIPLATLKRWMTNKGFPSFMHLLQLCHMSRTPLVSFFANASLSDIPEKLPVQKPLPFSDPPTRSQIDVKSLNRQMRQCITKEKEPSSLSAVARRLGTTTKTLREKHPNLAKQIAEKHRSYASRHREERQLSLLEAAYSATDELTEAGIYPSQDRVEALLRPLKAPLREPAIKKKWQEYKMQLGLFY